jgi:hypothetical protein
LLAAGITLGCELLGTGGLGLLGGNVFGEKDEFIAAALCGEALVEGEGLSPALPSACLSIGSEGFYEG